MHLPRYQANLEKMKKSGYEVIEYARKSKGVSYLTMPNTSLYL